MHAKQTQNCVVLLNYGRTFEPSLLPVFACDPFGKILYINWMGIEKALYLATCTKSVTVTYHIHTMRNMAVSQFLSGGWKLVILLATFCCFELYIILVLLRDHDNTPLTHPCIRRREGKIVLYGRNSTYGLTKSTHYIGRAFSIQRMHKIDPSQ